MYITVWGNELLGGGLHYPSAFLVFSLLQTPIAKPALLTTKIPLPPKE